jgi:MFS superfamily sulfate permease-like transporter
MTDVDTTAADMLEALDLELEAAGIHLAFAEMKDAVRAKIRDYGVEWLADRDAFYPTVKTAVRRTARRRASRSRSPTTRRERVSSGRS